MLGESDANGTLEELELVEFGLEDDPGLGPIEKNYQCVVQADFDNQGEVRLPPDAPLEGAECRCCCVNQLVK